MKRLLNALIIASVSLLPSGAAADTNLQPPLDQILVAAPAGYALFEPSGMPHGFFGLDQYAASWGGANAQDASQTLQQDGFVGGYELQWTDQPNTRVLIESVIAFSGGKGAQSWWSTGNSADHHDAAFQHDDPLPSLGSSAYGVHSIISSTLGRLTLDAFAFARGNDVVAVGFLSEHDDVLGLATTQAATQYAHTPDYTIPPSQWPENAVSSEDAFPLAGVLIGALIIAALAGAAAGAYVLWKRPRQPAAAPVVAMPVPLQMSPDGNFWFDGARWVASAQEPPPFAQRSPDGAMWWDGFGWRPVPETAQPGKQAGRTGPGG